MRLPNRYHAEMPMNPEDKATEVLALEKLIHSLPSVNTTLPGGRKQRDLKREQLIILDEMIQHKHGDYLIALDSGAITANELLLRIKKEMGKTFVLPGPTE